MGRPVNSFFGARVLRFLCADPIRTSADARAAWLFGVADTGHMLSFRNGVRTGVLTAVAVTVLVPMPLHAVAWGVWIALMHAVNGAAVGWLLVEIACGDVEQPLLRTIAPNDALNTVGAVFLGAVVIAVFIVARIECAALTGGVASVVFPLVMLSLAGWVHSTHERDQRAATVPPGSSVNT